MQQLLGHGQRVSPRVCSTLGRMNKSEKVSAGYTAMPDWASRTSPIVVVTGITQNWLRTERQRRSQFESHNVQMHCWGHPAAYTVCTGISFGGKAAGA
jgi:hypothetical protein